MAVVLPDLVLHARLAMLRAGLEKVKDALNDLERARRAAADRSERDTALRVLIDAASTAVKEARNLLDQQPSNVRSAFERDVVQPLDSAQIAASGELEAASVATRVPLIGTSVEQNIEEEVRDRLEELDALETLLARARGADDEAERERLLGETWAGYVACDDECKKIFDEYVDLVRGVLFRDAELDDQLFRIADELVRVWGRFKDYTWESLTIPAAHDHRSMSAARLIRIGFPEWSIWVLPVTAHEFGHVFASRHDRIQPVVEAVSREAGLAVDEVRSWAADAFATGVMGPAFVWAAVLLRTDPGSPADRRRVSVMLKMLEALVEGSADYEAELTRLREAWTHVLGQAAPGAASEAEAIGPLVAKVVDMVRQRIPEPFAARDWERVLELVDEIEDDAKPIADVAGELQLRDLRHVLVAAWRARIRLTCRVPDDGDDADAFADAQRDHLHALAVRTRQVCVAVIDAAGEVRGSRVAGLLPVDERRGTASADVEKRASLGGGA